MFLETLQNSQENTCARGEISRNTFSYRTPLVAASAVCNHSQGIVHLVRMEISVIQTISYYYKREIFRKITIPFPLTRIFCVRTKQIIFRPDGFQN